MTHGLFGTCSSSICPCFCQLIELGYSSFFCSSRVASCLNARVFMSACMRAGDTDLPKPSWSACEKRSVSGQNWRPNLPAPPTRPNVSSVTCLHLIPSYGLLLRRGGDRWALTITKMADVPSCSSWWELGMAVAKLGKLKQIVLLGDTN